MQAEDRRWLVEGLWSDRAVGIVGGEPKCCKSFLALDVAVSVASGAPCLRRFPVTRPGAVLLFAAEDALHVVRNRLEGIARSAGVDFAALDMHVITAPVLRLDHPADQQRLTATVAAVQPRLLILDPFVRLHRIDENAAAEVAPLLAYLRTLERCHAVSVLLVHHARKGAAKVRAGQALRGSSELHAWGDSNLYLRRTGAALFLNVEHRAAAAIDELALELRTDDGAVALHVVERLAAEPDRPIAAIDRIAHVLQESPGPLTRHQLRVACRLRAATLGEGLHQLEHQGAITKCNGAYCLTPVSVSSSPLHPPGNGNGKPITDTILPGETEAGSAETQPAKG
jgi:hypothetical protein